MVSDWPKTLPHRIDQIAQERQAKVALMDGIGSSLTYSSMISRIEAIGEALQSSGIGAGSRVLVFQQASSQWICSMLAIMRIGGVYVPLDLRNPMPRLAAVANDCNPHAVLVDDTTHKNVEQLHVSYAHVLDVSHVGKEPSTPIPNAARADSPAAILYTSGSTGTPKGIVVTHAGLRNEIEGYTKTWKLGAERTLQQSAYTFNHSSDQIYTGLVNGGMVYTVPCSKRGDPLEITKILQEHSITYTKATPSEYSLWMQYGGEALRQASHWCRAFGGGEALTSTVTREFADLGLPQLRIFNSYGPTEITISSTKTEVEYRDAEKMDVGRIPCGYSLPNYFTYVVDEQLKPLPAGMPGEICLGGAGVSRGYINNQELTDKHFVSNPFASPADIANGWARMYRTGDIGHLQDDGAMVFHNRTAGDTQVKIRGLRIELCDIESNIIAASGGALRDAVVTLREGSPDFLVAHVVFAQGQERKITDREGFLKQLLSNLTIPQYMVPVAAIPLEAFPLTSHSKVDRKAMKNLPLSKRVESSSSDNDEELTETMLQLKKVWQGVLGDSELKFDITPSSSFFLVGGNSLLVIRLQARIRERFNVVVRLVDLLDANTLGHMARKIEESLCVETIDWEHETMPPSTPSFLDGVSHINVDATKPKIVLVTGATGYLARHLLPKLVDSPDIETIHCVAVREKASEKSRELLGSPKIVTYNGDLTLPLLGLHEDEFRALASQVDVILHMGAVRSFWDNYHVLRASNVHPTKELVKLATPRQVPIHYISTVGVLPWGTTDAVSAAEHTPALDGTNGYVSSRWASERVLERSSQELGLETFVYRFLPSSTQVSSHNGNIEDANMDDLVRFVDISGQIPDTNGWHGRIDMMPADQAATWLSTSLVRQSTGSGTPATEFMHSESPIAIDIAELGRYIDQQRGHKGLERVPGLKWMGRIKALGFEYFLTTQEATVNGENGAKFESRR